MRREWLQMAITRRMELHERNIGEIGKWAVGAHFLFLLF